MPTTTTSMNDTVYAAELERDVQFELRPHRIFRPFLRQGPKGNSLVFSFVTQDDEGSAGTDITEGTTDMASNLTTISTTNANATAAQTAFAALVTDLLKEVSILDVSPHVSGVLARSMGEQYDVDAQAVLDNATNDTGGATTNTLARFLTARSALEQRDVGSQGERLVCGLHPKQVGDLQADAASLAAAFLAGDNARVNGILVSALDGYVGDPFGVPTFQSTTISSASSAYQGWIMAANSAVGAYEIWVDKIGLQRDESKISDEVIVSGAYGFALIDQNRIQGFLSTT